MDHTNSDCLAIIAMSHGDNGKIYAKDRYYPTKTLWKYFNAKSCPSLAGKPKLFFIQVITSLQNTFLSKRKFNNYQIDSLKLVDRYLFRFYK